jgi:hypothetical protein
VISHPTADELLAATIGFIEKIAPDLKDRDVFLARVAVNALATVSRELTEGAAAEAKATEGLSTLLDAHGDFATLNAKLCADIRAGRFDGDDAALLRHLRAAAIDQVKIDQPNYSGLKTATRPS